MRAYLILYSGDSPLTIVRFLFGLALNSARTKEILRDVFGVALGTSDLLFDAR